ncbi:MAG: protoporphyrinogen oxidase [Candidatus Acidiferrales bacterium]
MPGPRHVIVIGAGLSGLACAHRLNQLGAEVTVLEASDRAGGLLGTIRKDGFLFESGPQSFQLTEILRDLIRELGIENELQKADPSAARYILLHGRLQKIPTSPQAMLTSSLLGAGSRWKILSEPFRKTRPPAGEESVASFARRKFGNEILEYLVGPFVSGVYAGDPEMLSLKAAFPSLDEWEREYGSVLRGAKKARTRKGPSEPESLCSFQQGVATLPSAMAAKLGDRLQTQTRAISLNPNETAGNKTYEVRIERAVGSGTMQAAAIVIATPAYVSAHLIESISARLGHTLSGIAYAPVAVVAAGYYQQQVGEPMNGFGFLVPRTEKLHTLGTVWNSSLFPGRAPRGAVTLTSFTGGATNPEIAAEPDGQIAKIIQSENERILKIIGSPVTSAVRKYPRALPQYNLGHGHVVEEIRDAERNLPGIFFAGNYLEGPSVGKCVENGFRTADAVQKYLQSKN